MNDYTLSPKEALAIAQLAVTQALIKVGHASPSMTKSEAYSLYKRPRIDKYIKAGLLKFKQDTPKGNCTIDRMHLESVMLADNRSALLGTE